MAHVVGDQTLDQFATLNEELIALLDAGDAPVHLLIDVSQMGSIPSNIMKVQQTFTYLRHPALGWSLFIGEMNALTRLVVSVTNQVSGLDIKLVNTLEEALLLLKRVDLTLADDIQV